MSRRVFVAAYAAAGMVALMYSPLVRASDAASTGAAEASAATAG